MNIEPFKDSPFGAKVSGLDCGELDTTSADALRLALHDHQVLVIAAQQHLTPSQEVAFYQAIEETGAGIWRDQRHNPWELFKVEQGNLAGTYQIPDEPGVLVIGKGEIEHFGLNVTLGGDRGAYGTDIGSQVLGGGALQWHIDGTFYAYLPCRFTQMRCIEAPTGPGHWLSYGDDSNDRLWAPAGSTAFASGRIAFDLLPEIEREICLTTRVHYASNPFQATYPFANSSNGLRVIDMDAETRYEQANDITGSVIEDLLAQVYPLVWTCPVTGLQALMPQPRCMHALEIDGQFSGVVESRHQVEAWMRPAISSEYVYVHDWQPGDLVIWNNRSVWHSATGKLSRDDRRIMHLTAFNGSEPPNCNIA